MGKFVAGNKMPDFTFKTASGRDSSVSKMVKGKKNTVFWVLRYIGCTTCRHDIHLMKQNYGAFEELDAQICVVLQSTPENVKRDLAGDEAPFEIICDPKVKIYELLGVEAAPDMESLRPKAPEQMAKLMEKVAKIKEAGFEHGEYEGNEQQLPAIFVVDNQGNIVHAHYAENIIDMPAVEEILDLLAKV